MRHSDVAIESLCLRGTYTIARLQPWCVSALTSLLLRRVELSNSGIRHDILSKVFGILTFPNLEHFEVGDLFHLDSALSFLARHSDVLRLAAIAKLYGTPQVTMAPHTNFIRLESLAAPLALLNIVLSATAGMPALRCMCIRNDMSFLTAIETQRIITKASDFGVQELEIPLEICPKLLCGARETKWVGSRTVRTLTTRIENGVLPGFRQRFQAVSVHFFSGQHHSHC